MSRPKKLTQSRKATTAELRQRIRNSPPALPGHSARDNPPPIESFAWLASGPEFHGLQRSRKSILAMWEPFCEVIEQLIPDYDCTREEDWWRLAMVVCDAAHMSHEYYREISVGDEIYLLRALAAQKRREGDRPVPPVDNVEWTKPDLPSHWARVFSVSLPTFLSLLKNGKITSKKLTNKSYQINIADLPAAEKAKHRGDKNGPAK